MSQPTVPPLPLRDIHLPEPISWWPPAPGWWLLAGVLLLLGLLGGRWLRGRRQRRLTTAALEHIASLERRDMSDRELAEALSTLIRRVALAHFPRDRVAGLCGEAWLHFLDLSLSADNQQHPFRGGCGRALIEAPYHPRGQIDRAALLALARDWVTRTGRSRRVAR